MKKIVVGLIFIFFAGVSIWPGVIKITFGEPMIGIRLFGSQSIFLFDKPEVELTIPSLQQPRFGKITLNNQDFYLVVGMKEDGKPVILFDCNGNHDLTDDLTSYDLLSYYEEGSVAVITHAMVRYGTDVVPYYVYFRWFSELTECKCRCKYSNWINYARATYREGILTAGNTELPVYIVETNCDGVYSKDDTVLMVDFNQNGQIEETEIFCCFDILRISGRFYKVKEVSRSGDSVVLEETEEEEFYPILGEELIFSDLQLTDIKGNPAILEKGKWKLVYFTQLDINSYSALLKDAERIKKVLGTFSQIENLQIIAIIEPSCWEASCWQDPVDAFFDEMKDMDNVPVIGLEEGEEKGEYVARKLKLHIPETIMLISPENKLVYKSPIVVVDISQPFWKVVYANLDDPLLLVKALVSCTNNPR
ncbi:MAG: hypothetical protein J7L52_07495 [Thermotogae bacterium]|nr:hypothetical protein [Thermotogota bacterium]